jgi:CRP/FNR family cyclic AMP-dependent transcriptional regulator
MGAGDLFGEIAVLDGGSAARRTPTAGEPTELFVLRREDFLSYLEREPRVAVKLIALLCQQIRRISERMEESVLQPLSVRMARRLCALAADFGSEVHISQEQLGTYVGAARESVNRQLQQWRRDKLLELHRGRIEILNMNKLRAQAREESLRRASLLRRCRRGAVRAAVHRGRCAGRGSSSSALRRRAASCRTSSRSGRRRP